MYEMVEYIQRILLSVFAPSPVSAEDIERGYRVVSEVEESSTLPILAGSITNDLLR